LKAPHVAMSFGLLNATAANEFGRWLNDTSLSTMPQYGVEVPERPKGVTADEVMRELPREWPALLRPSLDVCVLSGSEALSNKSSSSSSGTPAAPEKVVATSQQSLSVIRMRVYFVDLFPEDAMSEPCQRNSKSFNMVWARFMATTI